MGAKVRWRIGATRAAMAALLLVGVAVWAGNAAAAGEPVNPFGPPRAPSGTVPGAVYVSDGTTYVGDVYLSAGRRLRVFDPQRKAYVYFGLRDLKAIRIEVVAERIEREWRFKEGGSDEKVYTGKSYPRRDYRVTLEPLKGKPVTMELADGMPVYILTQPAPTAAEGGDKKTARPAAAKRERKQFLLQPYADGEVGTTLKDLLYVQRIELGDAAVTEALKAKGGAEQKVEDRAVSPDAPARAEIPEAGRPGQEERHP